MEKGRWDEEGYEIDYGEEIQCVQIYVNDKPFLVCTYLLIINPQNDEKFDEIESIDDAKALLSEDLEFKIIVEELNITLEEEFWAHCSNIQAWAENEYDTRLLHSNLAFPLLRKLMKEGSKKAREVYSEETLRRYAEGTRDIKKMLLVWDYFDYIPFEKQISIFEDSEEYDVIVLLHELLDGMLKLGDFRIEDGRITELTLKDRPYVNEIPEEIGNLRHLRILTINLNNITALPESLGNLKSLEKLLIKGAKLLSLPESLGNLTNLKMILIENCDQLEKVPDSIGKLKDLETLWLTIQS